MLRACNALHRHVLRVRARHTPTDNQADILGRVDSGEHSARRHSEQRDNERTSERARHNARECDVIVLSTHLGHTRRVHTVPATRSVHDTTRRAWLAH